MAKDWDAQTEKGKAVLAALTFIYREGNRSRDDIKVTAVALADVMGYLPISIASADEHPAVLAWRLLEARQLLSDLSDAFYQWATYRDWGDVESIVSSVIDNEGKQPMADYVAPTAQEMDDHNV